MDLLGSKDSYWLKHNRIVLTNTWYIVTNLAVNWLPTLFATQFQPYSFFSGYLRECSAGLCLLVCLWSGLLVCCMALTPCRRNISQYALYVEFVKPYLMFRFFLYTYNKKMSKKAIFFPKFAVSKTWLNILYIQH